MADILRIARKEFRGYFATPAAYLFIGGFLAVNLFVFFWVETFFARNIADVRPLFKWMPVLLIFLSAALTMRSWSEERRAGTLETLLTAPVPPIALVLGKFLAAMALIALALVMTLPLPATVSLLGSVDWGPVIGGYVATLFLAAAYIAVGLAMSSRTDNPIVALILTTLVCGALYLVGSETLTGLFGTDVRSALSMIGSGSRFESITRGVLDLRDLYYCLSIVGVFLALNLFSLERLRWAGNPPNRRHRLWGAVAALAVLNLIAANFWLAPISEARADLTRENVYSLSEATERQLAQLGEPLVIRGYFSAQTHPLLAPLVPRLRDLLAEYAIAADGRAIVEFVDPTSDPAREEEAAQQYGIRPVPFQTASRYRTAVVNSYFDIVVAYGDQFETLGYADLIEVKARGEDDLEVVLKNPEYEITRAIRKVANAYRAGGSPFDNLRQPVTFKGYVSPLDRLPEPLRRLRSDLDGVLDDLGDRAGDKLQVSFADPEADGGALAARLAEDYGFGPQITSLLDPQPFWFTLMLESGDEAVPIPLPASLDRAGLERAVDSALRRLAPGFLRTVALMKPPAPPNPYMPGGLTYGRLGEVLSENARVIDVDLKDGRVPEDVDLLMVLAPRDLDDKQRFAIDQFLMRGGSVVLATSPFDIELAGSLSATRHDSGLSEWLAGYGVGVGDAMVLDPRNAALPVPVEREVAGLSFREIRMLPYPHFPDLRGGQLNADSPVTADLDQLTVNWVSPVTVDADKNDERVVTQLLTSSPESWTSGSLEVLPDYSAFPETGFAVPEERGASVLAVALEGRFESFYAGKDPPLLAAAASPEEGAGTASDDAAGSQAEFAGVIDRSPESARLVVIGSNTFGADVALDLVSQGLGTRYTKPLELIQNIVDWSLEDEGLLALRGRTQLARTLRPLPEATQQAFEYLNYALALLGVGAAWGWRRFAARSDRRRYQRILQEA